MASNTLCKAFRILHYNKYICCNLFAPRQMVPVQMSPKWLSLSANKYCDFAMEDPQKKSRKKIFIPKITLLEHNNDMTVMTLEEAEKVAKRRNLKLIRVVDINVRSERPVYKLMKMQDFLKEEAQAKAEAKANKEKAIKDDKTISIAAKIAEHDLNTKLKSIHKMLKKRHGVKIIISCDGNAERAKQIREHLIENCAEIAKPITKNDSALHVKVTLRPIVEKVNEEMKKEQVSDKENEDHE